MATAATLPELELPHFRFDPNQYQQMQDLGWFNGDKVELLDGVVWNHSSVWSNGDPAGPQRFTLEQCYWMADQNWFEGRRVMLLDGELITMPTPKPGHVYSVEATADRLRRDLGPGLLVRTQAPLIISAATDTEPDIAVVAGQLMDYRDRHPTTAPMTIEVSDTTLRLDRKRKASLHARANIPDYWIINLVDSQVEVHRRPQPDESQPYGHGYADITVYKPGQQITPLCKPDMALAVNDMLP